MTASEKVYEGSCHCGRVRYRVTGPWGPMNHCHCTDCQKVHGAAFATYVQIPRERFTYLQGEDQLRTHQAEAGTQRSFCRTCGAKITSGSAEEPASLWVAVATLDTPLDQKLECDHIFVRSKAPWYDIHDDLPQHQTYAEPDA
ncbi:MAG: GFA family protein [Acidobacteriota bacterium]